MLICEKREGEESLLARVVSRCAASVSLSAVGVSSDDQSGRGWVEKDIGREGRGRETERGEKRFNLCLDNAALSRQIIIHEPIYIIPCTGALSYHSHALKYQSLFASPSLPPLPSLYRERRLCLCDRQKKLRVASSIERPETRGFRKVIFDVRRAPTLPVRLSMKICKVPSVTFVGTLFFRKSHIV